MMECVGSPVAVAGHFVKWYAAMCTLRVVYFALITVDINELVVANILSVCSGGQG